jgi:hypothetical protein
MWALEAVKSGLFAAPALVGRIPFVDLQAMIAARGGCTAGQAAL